MKYPKEFIEKCKHIYPDFTSLHDALDNGYQIVGRYLNDSCGDGIPYETILKSDNLENLKQIAQNGKDRKDIYFEWSKIFKEGMF